MGAWQRFVLRADARPRTVRRGHDVIGEDGTLITVEGEPAARPVSAGMRVGSILLGALLALVSIGTAVWVVLVGHAGAVSVWQG